MPLSHVVFPEKGYFLVRYHGRLSSGDILENTKRFYESADWFPGLNELVDLSEADFSDFAPQEMSKLIAYTNGFYQSRGCTQPVKVAIYAPTDLPYGLSRIYMVMAKDLPEAIRVFRNLADAEKWVTASS